ncbi:MAG TPA: IS110 family transposase [Puia sp.]|jgi:transposase|nr:IS110 family transposase [Puia sp.]
MPNTKLQKSIDFRGQKFFIGLDVHKNSWSVTLRSLNLLLEHFSQPPSVRILINHLHKKYPGGEYYSAYEAGFCGTGIHEELCRGGVHNIIVHAADIPCTDKQNKNKTDVRDSRSIAFHLEKGNLHGIYIMPKDGQELRSLFRFREAKVRDLARTTNRLKGFLNYYGVRFSLAFDGREYISSKVLTWLSKLELASEVGKITLKRYMDDLVYHRRQLLETTHALRKEIQARYREPYECLLSVPGIGAITAIALLAEIGDFNRFDNPREYCSFLGLIPWEDSSGDSMHTKGIQPRCNKHLRPLIVEASWIAIRKEPLLLNYYRRHAIKNSKHAIIKVARKLALIAKGVVQKLQEYQSDYYSMDGKTKLMV